MNAETLLELAARAEAASGADRALDGEIGHAIGCLPKLRNINRRGHYIGGKPVVLRVEEVFPRFTASLDAAMTLVPEGWFILKLSESRKRDRCLAAIKKRGASVVSEWSSPECRSLALALTAASLRARAEHDRRAGTPDPIRPSTPDEMGDAQ